MMLQVLPCPHCHGTAIVRHGRTRQDQQRYRCREHPWAGRTCLLDASDPGQSPAVPEQIVDMALNASGRRDTAWVLHVSTNTVMKARQKKTPEIHQVHHTLLPVLHPAQVQVERCRSEELDRRRELTSER